MNKSNDMQTKKVFSAAKYLSEEIKNCIDEEILISSINPKGWVWVCDGKTIQECHDMHFVVLDDWCIEIPQDQNIDFWRNYTS